MCHRVGFAEESWLALGFQVLNSWTLGLGVTKVTKVDCCAYPEWLTESLGATGNGFVKQIRAGQEK